MFSDEDVLKLVTSDGHIRDLFSDDGCEILCPHWHFHIDKLIFPSLVEKRVVEK